MLSYDQHVHFPILCFLLTNQSAVLLGQKCVSVFVSVSVVCEGVYVQLCVFNRPLWSQGFVCMCAHVRGGG